MKELGRLLQSQEFAGAERLCRFLQFVVERTLAGDRESLKESVIGTEVFDREPGYDPKTEPIVRNTARRLRAKLDEYYEAPGRSYSVRISMPKGAYLASFAVRPQPIPLRVAEPVAPRRAASQANRWIRIAAGFAVIAAVAVYLGLRPKPPQIQPVLRTVTSYPGRQQQPALSPDGSQVAFVWGGEQGDNRDIYITMASGGVPRRITTDPAADDFPVWSPDGSTMAFVRESKSLMLTTPLGANERRLTSAYDSRPSWTPDGKQIEFIDWLHTGIPSLAVFVLDLATGNRRQVTVPGAAPGDTAAEISPTGSEIAFVRCTGKSCGVYRVPIGGGEPKLIWRASHTSISGITWSPDSRTLALATGRDGSHVLWSVPASGHGDAQLQPLTGEDNTNPSFGRSLPARLVWEHSIRDSNIWRLDLAAAKGQAALKRLVASTRLDSSPQIAPDGRSIVFVSDRTGTFQLWRVDADGRNPVQLTNYSYEYPGSARWSPDGTRIVFDLSADEGTAIYVVDASGGAAHQWTPWRECTRPSWSRDGRWIYYSDTAADHSAQIWKVSTADSRIRTQLTTTGAYGPFDSPDGKTIYYTRPPDELWSIPAAGGVPSLVLPKGVTSGWWAVSTRGIFFSDLYSGTAPRLFVPRTPKPIYELPNGSQQPTEVGRIDGEVTRETPDFTVSPDGRTALFSILETSTSQIRLLDGLR